MITLKDWMECVNHRITEGGEYGWRSFGSHAYSLDSWDGDQDGVSASIVFDTKTQIVYQAEVYDYSKERAYRLINKDFAKMHASEAAEKGVEDDIAYDGVKFIDLETEEDFLEKCSAIINYEEYDDRVSIPIDLPDKQLLLLMKMAHERDMTFNQFVEQALRHALEEFDRDPEAMKARAKEFRNV